MRCARHVSISVALFLTSVTAEVVLVRRNITWTRPRTRTLCSFESKFSNSGSGSVTSRTFASDGAVEIDERSIHLDWVTNSQECESAATSICEDCDGCPCRPVFDLDGFRSTSGYVISMCRKVVREYGCRFNNGIVIGLGIGSLSACLQEHCPRMNLTTVDVDPAALSLAVHFFGWRGGTVSLDGAGPYMQAARKRKESADLIVLDCFAKHRVPESCQTPQLLDDLQPFEQFLV